MKMPWTIRLPHMHFYAHFARPSAKGHAWYRSPMYPNAQRYMMYLRGPGDALACADGISYIELIGAIKCMEGL